MAEEHLHIKEDEEGIFVIFVKPSTSVQQLAKVIRSYLKENKYVATRSMGAGSVNQAVKAWAVVCELEDLSIVPQFQTVDWQGQPSSAVLLAPLFPPERFLTME